MLGLGAPSNPLTPAIASAISKMEGTTQNNNPGNLMAIPGTTYAGQTGVDSRGFAIFDSMASGEAQLEAQINLNISRGLSPEQFFCGGNGYAGYAPTAGGNDCTSYANYVASQVGIDPNTPIADQSSGDGTDTSGDGTDSTDNSSTYLIMAAAAASLFALWRFA